MSDTATNPGQEAPPAIDSENPWSQYPQVINALTTQRDRLAKGLRLYEAGEAEKVDPRQELQRTQDTLRKVWPNLPQQEDQELVDMSVRDLAVSYWDQVKQRKNTAPTGLPLLDEALSGGFESKRLVGILGAPNCGKTTFSHQMAEKIACAGRPVLYVTSEDTPSTLLAKTISRVGLINYSAVLKGWEAERLKIDNTLAMLMDRPSIDRLRYLDATGGITADIIRKKAEAHFTQYAEQDAKGGGPGILVIDYLQRLARSMLGRSGGSDLRQAVTQFTEWLRALACDLECCVLVVTAQNRNNYTRNESSAMASAKESGDIEYTCDVMLSLSEDLDKGRQAPPGTTPLLLVVDKNRQGPRGVRIPLDFQPNFQQFTEIAW